jgi:uncharacterized protein YndB with AHSA1/START domain
MKNQPFVIERTFNAPVEKVWKAITDKNQMKKWYFDLAEFKPVVGFQFQFEGGNEGRIYIHLCTITDVEINKKLRHSWKYKGFEGESFVTWELFPDGEKTRVRLTHEGLGTFPALKDFAKENFVAGWTSIVGKALKNFVEMDEAQRS